MMSFKIRCASLVGVLTMFAAAGAQEISVPASDPYNPYGQSAGAYGQDAGAYGQDAGAYGQNAGAYGQNAGGNYGFDDSIYANNGSGVRQGDGRQSAYSSPQNRYNFGLEPQSLPSEIAEDIASPAAAGAPSWGPTPVDDVQALVNLFGASSTLERWGLRFFGWVESGYTYSSTGDGLLSVQPRLNRFGNEYLLNQIGLVLQKPLQQDGFDWGFNIRYFAGADAALGQPLGGIDDPPGDPRFSHDFRDLNVTAHLPILTEGGMDIKVGRMNTIIGWNGFLSPYRPFYSSDYQFFYSQDGAFTGVLTNLHVTKKLDVWNGVTLGANTFFTKRSEDSICYIGQINYALTEERRTVLTSSVYCGPDAIFAAPGLAGDFVTMLEFRVQQRWNEQLTQIVQSNMGWDSDTPVGTGSWYGLYTIGIWHALPKIDVNTRAEWFQDTEGTRTGIATDYGQVTLGLNWHPSRSIEFRPEIRGDFAGAPAFGNNNTPASESQLTCASSVLIKF